MNCLGRHEYEAARGSSQIIQRSGEMAVDDEEAIRPFPPISVESVSPFVFDADPPG